MSYPDKEFGNGFIFRDSFQVIDSYSVPLPQVAKLKWYEKQKTEGGRPDTKSAFVQRFGRDGWSVQVANVHLDFSGGSKHRHRQLDYLLSEIRTRSTIPGDDSLDGALSRGFVDATHDLDYTSDLFGSVDPADPAAGFLNFGKKLGCRFLQKTDHILGRGFSSYSESGIIPHPQPRLFEVSDHLPIHTMFET